MQATEQLSLDQALAYFPEVNRRGSAVLARLRRIAHLPEHPRIVDVGSAQGNFLVACARQGCEAVGIEPWEQARITSGEVAKRAGVSVTILDGTAESLPLESNAYDVVHANAVIEHVTDADAAFREAARVLKPGGVFWFSAASAVCPRQAEIRGFPFFGWYPNALKVRIMRWAAEHRPELDGHTTRPAIQWFTPWKARRALRAAGFTRIYDRWDLRLPSEGSRTYALFLRAVKASPLTKLLADLLVPECSYAAIK